MPTRRRFLQSAAVGLGLVIGLRLERALAQQGPTGPDVFMPNAFVRIAPDNTVTIIAKHIEFGQGAHTGLATLLAEELDADWSQIRVEAAPADVARYNNLAWGPVQGTGGSTAIANSWEQLRRAGATARAMLVAAAAQVWQVPAGEITVDRGVLTHAASGRRATFGELAPAAARQTPPASVALKDPRDFKLIGRNAPRVDSRPKTTGAAVYTCDVHLPDMLTAVIARPPRFGATVRSFDASGARRVPGVTDVVQVPSGVAVIARGTWAAIKGRRALSIDWAEAAVESRGSEELYADYRRLAAQPGVRARWQGIRRPRSPAPLGSSKPSTSSRTSRTLQWSRSTVWSGSARTNARSGSARRLRPSTSRRWPPSSASLLPRCASTPSSPAAASAGTLRPTAPWRRKPPALPKPCAARGPSSSSGPARTTSGVASTGRSTSIGSVRASMQAAPSWRGNTGSWDSPS